MKVFLLFILFIVEFSIKIFPEPSNDTFDLVELIIFTIPVPLFVNPLEPLILFKLTVPSL